MEKRRVAVVGGGPGGLYAARLIKLARPDWEVTVYERNAARRTFGFGVGLTQATLRNLAAADPESALDIRRAGHSGHGLRLDVERSILLHGARNIAIGRATLLEILRTHAEAAGVHLVTGEQVHLGDLDADIIVAADGARSAIREKLSAELGASVEPGRGLYLWCGTDFALEDAVFRPVRTEHGLFVTHAYPYAAGRSTVLIETDERTWRSAGLDVADAGTPEGVSDERSLAYLRSVFADLLRGHELLGNRSRWQRFGTVHARRWYHDNVVLVGDAAHTAHYTLGSGTKLALEDAIDLARCLAEEPVLSVAFERYERHRRPGADRFQRLARRSQLWWESFPERAGLSSARLAVSFMTRAGNISLGQFADANAEIVADAVREYAEKPVSGADIATAERLTAWVLDRPLSTGRVRTSGRAVTDAELESWRIIERPTPERIGAARSAGAGPVVACLSPSIGDPGGPDAERLSAECARLVAAGADVLWLTGSWERAAGLSRLALAEHLRLSTGAVVGVDLPSRHRADAVAGLVAGRVDLVYFIDTRRNS